MAKAKWREVLLRWLDMDRALGCRRPAEFRLPGLHIPQFAEHWEVSEKTVRRDLKIFRALGQYAVPHREAKRYGCRRRTYWLYCGRSYLFSPEARARTERSGQYRAPPL
jgi:hypothetical protein